MSEPTKAVFLSYASQDAEAARRICDSLRSGGVEVWFDADGGLEHGDEWDAKIRRQIKECVLFIPVISANTQARHEGYFRIEWDLAAERARGIASGVPFILPVVIDDTREPDALVPDRFRMVQWTKLRGGEVPADVKQRFLKLWSHRTGVLKHEADVGRGRRTPPLGDTSAEVAGLGELTPQSKPRRMATTAVIMAAVVLGVVAAYVALRPATNRSALPSTAARAVASPSETEGMRARIFSISAMQGDAEPADLALAEDLGAQLVAREPNNADDWAAYATATLNRVAYEGDGARYGPALSRAQRALSLADSAFEPRLAIGNAYVRKNDTRDEGVRLLRALVDERPAEKRALVALADSLRAQGKAEEALGLVDRAIALQGNDPADWNLRARVLLDRGRIDEAEAAVEKSLALRVGSRALMNKGYIQIFFHDDMEGAAATIAQIPGSFLRRDVETLTYSNFWLAHRKPEKCLERLRAAPGDFILDTPKGLIAGCAHELAGRHDAAELEWRAALRLVEGKLGEKPNDPQLLYWQSALLTWLGEKTRAERTLALARQLDPTLSVTAVAVLLARLGQYNELLAELNGHWDGLGRTEALALRVNVANHFAFDPLRGDPRFRAFVERIRTDPRFPFPIKKNVVATRTTEADSKSVAVLAFANLSDDKGNEYFSDGISEELLTVLQKIPGLHVAARTSAFSFKGKNATAKEVGEKLGMAHVVEGSVQKQGNRVKITARLSRAATNEELWSESFGPLELTDIFATQSEIAQKIVARLRGQLTGEAAKVEIQAQVQAAGKGGTKNSEAYQLYLQGRFLALRANPADIARGIDYYEKAVAADPAFAAAWAALARARLWQGSWETVFLERFRQAQAAAEKALALEPELADAHSAISQVMQRHFFDWRRSREESVRAVALAPTDSGVLADACANNQMLGDLARSIELGQRAVALDPVNADARLWLAVSYLFSDRLSEAKAEIRRMLELAPSANFAHLVACMILVSDGHPDEALAEAKLEPERMHQLEALALAEFARGHRSESDAALAELKKTFADNCPYQIAEVYAYRNEPDGAFEWLEHAWQVRDPGVSWFKVATLLRNLHKDPRWPELLKKVGLSDEQLK